VRTTTRRVTKPTKTQAFSDSLTKDMQGRIRIRTSGEWHGTRGQATVDDEKAALAGT